MVPREYLACGREDLRLDGADLHELPVDRHVARVTPSFELGLDPERRDPHQLCLGDSQVRPAREAQQELMHISDIIE